MQPRLPYICMEKAPMIASSSSHVRPARGPRPAPVTRVIAAIMGNALEFYDFTVYAAFAAMIGRAFFPATNPQIGLLLSVATFGVGFFARPLGGILIGAYADRFGRRPAMTLTIWLMALGSGMIGLLPTYQQIGVLAPLLLVLARLIQGFSAGGEMGPATTYLLESAPPERATRTPMLLRQLAACQPEYWRHHIRRDRRRACPRYVSGDDKRMGMAHPIPVGDPDRTNRLLHKAQSR